MGNITPYCGDNSFDGRAYNLIRIRYHLLQPFLLLKRKLLVSSVTTKCIKNRKI